MSKKKFYVLQSDADTLPAEMKGIYTGDEFPEYKGAETITFNNKTYINGLDYQTVKSGKHVRIEECPICNRLSIIYARGVCKACAQRTLYRHRRDKTGDVMTERNIREANIAFRKGWPVNMLNYIASALAASSFLTPIFGCSDRNNSCLPPTVLGCN